MNNFEEVRNKIAVWQRNPDIYLGHGKGYRKMAIDDLAYQICQLFKPKPDSPMFLDSKGQWRLRPDGQ